MPGQPESSSLGSSSRPYHRSVARVGVQVAQALAYAHQEGVIHRDIKPSNLLLDTEGRVWITDFGLAKTVGAALTHTGDVVGTVRYMAPERFNGWSDPRSDVYSLGITLYEMLLLRPAFEAPDRMKLIHQVTHEEPPRPRKLQPSIPCDLETIVVKAIDKEPGRRYQTATALAEDLQRFVEDRPILARRISWAERTWRWCRRNPMVASLIVAVILVTLTGFAATIGQMKKANDKAEEASQNAEQAMRKEREATEQRNAARTANARLLAAQGELRHTLYAAHLNLVQHAWEADNVGRVLELLAGLVPKPAQSDLRGFEWYYWNRLCHSDLHTVDLQGFLRGSELSLSSDGKRIAASVNWSGIGPNDRVKIWDTGTGKPILEIPLTGGRSVRIWKALSPDGLRLATIRQESFSNKPDEIKLWDVASGKELHTILSPRDRGVLGVAIFSPDGMRLAKIIEKEKRELKVWSVTTGKEVVSIATAPEPLENPLAPVFSPDGTHIASSWGLGTRTHVWELATGRQLCSIEGSILAFTPDGQRILSTATDQGVRVSSATDGKELFTFAMPDGLARQSNSNSNGKLIIFSPDGELIATVSKSGRSIRLLDPSTGKIQRTLKGHAGVIQALAFSSDGRQIISAASDGTVKVWDTTIPQEPLPCEDRSFLFRFDTSVSPDGMRRASVEGEPAGPHRSIKVRDTTGKELGSFALPPGRSEGIAFSSDGSRLAVLWRPHHPDANPPRVELKLWEIASGKEVFPVPGSFVLLRGGYRATILFSPDNSRIAVESHVPSPDGKGGYVPIGVRMWDSVTGKEILAVEDRERIYKQLTFSADSRRFAAAFRSIDADRDHLASPSGVEVWDAITGNRVSIVEGDADYSSVTFSPDDTILAAGTSSWVDQASGEVHVWHVNPAQRHRVRAPNFILKGHSSSSISSVVFSPDGSRMVSAGSTTSSPMESEVKVWDTGTYRELMTLKGPKGFGGPLVFSPDGRRLLAIKSLPHRQILQAWDGTPLPEQSAKKGP